MDGFNLVRDKFFKVPKCGIVKRLKLISNNKKFKRFFDDFEYILEFLWGILYNANIV